MIKNLKYVVLIAITYPLRGSCIVCYKFSETHRIFDKEKIYIFTIIFILFVDIVPYYSIAEKTILSSDLRIDTVIAIPSPAVEVDTVCIAFVITNVGR